MARFEGVALPQVIACMHAIDDAAKAAAHGDDGERRMFACNACALLLRLVLDSDPETAVAVINNAFDGSGWRLVAEH